MKFSKKCISILLTAACLCVSAVGCSQENEKDTSNTMSTAESGTDPHVDAEYFKVLPGKLKDDYVICPNKANLEISKDCTMQSVYSFDIISTESLEDSDIKVEIDTNIPYYLILKDSVESKEKFERNVCLQYNDFDWKKYNDLMSNSEQKEYLEIDNKINEEYDSLTDDQFPHFYEKRCSVQFDIDDLVGEPIINEMKVNVKDKSYNIDVGEIKFSENLTEKGDYGEYDLLFNSAGIIGYDLGISKDGIISLPPREAEIKNDIKIKDIRLNNRSETISVDTVSIDIEDEDASYNQVWKKGKDLELSKGSKATFNFAIKDTAFEKTLNYAVNIYIVIEYESGGKNYIAEVQADCEGTLNSHILYAIYNDNIDFGSYCEYVDVA